MTTDVCPLPASTYPLEKLPPQWANADVSYRQKGQLVHRTEIIDLRGDEPVRYIHEPLRMIAFKCFGLFIAVLPLYFAIYTVFHLLRLPLVTLVNLSPKACMKQIWAIARIPFYFFALEYAALLGIFKPLEGRALFGRLESALHDGKNRRAAIQYKYKKEEEFPYLEVSWKGLTEKENADAFFVGFCMQPIGKTTDPHIIGWPLLPDPATPPAV